MASLAEARCRSAARRTRRERVLHAEIPGYATVRIAGGGPTQLLLGRSVLTLRVGPRGRSYRVAAPSGHREHSADSDQDQGQHPARADSGVTPVKATTRGSDVHDGWSMGGRDKPIGLL